MPHGRWTITYQPIGATKISAYVYQEMLPTYHTKPIVNTSELNQATALFIGALTKAKQAITKEHKKRKRTDKANKSAEIKLQKLYILKAVKRTH